MSNSLMIPLSGAASSMKRSALQDALEAGAGPDSLSLALGLPAPELFPTEAIAAATARVLAQPGGLQYGPASPDLKARIVELMAERGVTCHEDEVIVTSGAQQAIALLCAALLDRHGPLISERLVYPGFRQAVVAYEPRLTLVESDYETGIDCDAVARHLAAGKQTALLYVSADAHNPLGVSLPAESRIRLIELARLHGFPIVEDDAYGFLSYEDGAPCLKALGHDAVIYIGSLSKVLAPALRVGWIVAPPPLIDTLANFKEAFDINTATFASRVAAEVLGDGSIAAHIERLRTAYRLRRDAMIRALEIGLDGVARWNRPNGGVFLWLELPPGMAASALARRAAERERVACVPSAAFDLGQPEIDDAVRLNFSRPSHAAIEDGIARLSRAVHALAAERSGTRRPS